MKVVIIATFIFLSGSLLWARSGHFAEGNLIQVAPIEGILRINCTDFDSFPVNRQVTTKCMRSAFGKYNMRDSHFFVELKKDDSLKADKVYITITRPDGTIKEKKSIFVINKYEARSTKIFNIWNSYVFQKPLMQYGINKVSFTLKYKGVEVHRGNFDFIIERVEPRECSYMEIHSDFAEDCKNPRSRCDEFFMRQNYCI